MVQALQIFPCTHIKMKKTGYGFVRLRRIRRPELLNDVLGPDILMSGG